MAQSWPTVGASGLQSGKEEEGGKLKGRGGPGAKEVVILPYLLLGTERSLHVYVHG